MKISQTLPDAEIVKLFQYLEKMYDVTTLPTKAQISLWEQELGVETLTNILYHIVNSRTPDGRQVISKPAGFIVNLRKNKEELENYAPHNYNRGSGKRTKHVPLWLSQLKERITLEGSFLSPTVEEDDSPQYQGGKVVTMEDVDWLFSDQHQQLYQQDPSRLLWLYRAGIRIKTKHLLQRHYSTIFGPAEYGLKTNLKEVKLWLAKNTDIELKSVQTD